MGGQGAFVPLPDRPADRLAEGAGGDDAAGVLVQFAEQLQLLGGEGADLPVPVGGGFVLFHDSRAQL